MEMNLINGNFAQNDAIDLITSLFEVKIKYHENKIDKSHNEEDIKMREQRIKQLQKSLEEAKKYILANPNSFHIESSVMLGVSEFQIN